jgi:membrane-associated phospholipid phosphatase
VGVAFAIVYTGEHYVTDVLAGVLYAVVVSWLTALLVGNRSLTVRVKRAKRSPA